MRGLASAAMLVFFGCAPQLRAPSTLKDSVVRNPLLAPETSPPELSPPQASQSEAPPLESSPSGAPVPSTSVPPSSEPPPAAAEPGPTAVETRQCSARGGTIQAVCMLGELVCVVRYRDGGKRCTDKRDCTGECLYERRDPAPPHATGSCQRTNDPCGCKAPIHHGRVQPAVCLD